MAENKPTEPEESAEKPKLETLQDFIVQAIYTAAAVANEMQDALAILSDEQAEELGKFIAEETARTATEHYKQAVLAGEVRGLL